MTAESTSRIVRCCHCEGMMRVPPRALSVFCPHCQKRATLESLRIIGSHPGKTLATCGDIFIEATANLNLSICANNVIIHGRVRGPVLAKETVEVGPTGQVRGDIKAYKIIVRDGALIQGRCEMTRPLRRPSAAPTSPQPNETPTAAGPTLPHLATGDDAASRLPAAFATPLPPPPAEIRPLNLG